MTPLARRIFLGVTSLLGAFVGSWAAVAPRGFYNSFPSFGFGPWIAVDGPYNEHLIRDVGGLNLALAAASVYAAIQLSARVGVYASRAVGIAWIVFSVPHLIYHSTHFAGLSGLDLAVEIISVGITLPLGILLVLPNRRSTPSQRTPARPNPTPTRKQGNAA